MRGLVESQVLEQMGTLPEDMKRQVLDYVKALRALACRGVPGQRLLPFAGSIPSDDLALMRQAVDDACERVDPGEW